MNYENRLYIYIFIYVFYIRIFLYQQDERAIPFNVHPPPYGREFLRGGVEKAISEGLCASGSFDLCFFSKG
jgi:hypothetical protein